MRNVRLALLIVAAGAALLAGCSNSARPPSGRGPLSTKPATTAPASSGGVDPHQAAAKAAAAALLAAYTPPPGSALVEAAPAGSGLDQAPTSPGTADLVDRPGLWTAPGDMATVIAWARAHPPAESTLTGSGQGGQNTPGEPPPVGPGGSPGIETVTTMDLTFSLPAPDGLQAREVLVSVAPDGSDQVALRVDAQDVWYPTRPVWSKPTVDSTVTATVFTGAGGTDPHVATATDTATVSRFRDLLNAMPVSTGGAELPGAHGCPAEFGQKFTVAFGDPGGPSATVSGTVVECGGLTLTEPGQPVVELVDTGGSLLAAAEALTGTTGFSTAPAG